MKNKREYKCLNSQLFSHRDYSIITIQDSFIEPIRNWRNQQINVLRQIVPISVQDQKDYFEKHIWPDMHQNKPNNILLGFIEGKELVGYGGLVNIMWNHKRAELSFLMKTNLTQDEEVYSKYFINFLNLVTTMAFNEIGMHKIFTETFSMRSKHIKVLEDFGFKSEGFLREHIFLDKRYIDSQLHGLINYAG